MSIEDNKRVVANFVELCQNQHDLAVKDEILHPDFVNQPVSAKTAAIGSRNPGRQVATCRRHQRQGGGLDVSSRYDKVALSTSKNGGASWSPPIRVNTPSGRPAFTPSVRANANGTVAVTYYDFRNLGVSSLPLPTDHWVTLSSDAGVTFGGEGHVAGPFDMLSAPNARGYFVGDYVGLDANGSLFRPFFVQANSGNTTNASDTFAAAVAP